MTPVKPSEELEKYIIYDIDNVHLKENTPQYLIEEFNDKFIDIVLVIE